MAYRLRPGLTLDGIQPGVRGLIEALGKSGIDFDITSGFRDPARNARVGGAKGSQHTHGNAFDVSTKGWDDAQREAFLKTAVENGAKGVGIYPNGSFHFDTRETPTIWGVGGSYRSSPVDKFPAWAQPHLNALLGGKGGALPPSIMAGGVDTGVPQLPASTGPAFGLGGPQSQPVDATKNMPAAPAAEAGKGILDNKDVTGGLDMLAKAFGGGKGQQQQQSSPMVPVSNYSAEQAARIPAAQALMSQLLMKNKMPRGMLG
jgi:hypothetical protein